MAPEAYVFKSGKRQGKSLPMMVFNDPCFLIEYYYRLTKMRERVCAPAVETALRQTRNLGQVVEVLGSHPPEFEKSAPQRQLEWLFREAGPKAISRLCPRCHNLPVTQASLLSGSSISYMLCGDWRCRESVEAEAAERRPVIVPLTFHQMFRGLVPPEFRMKLGRLLRTAHFGRNRITGQTVLNYFE